MLGKTHRITGIALYTGLLVQATDPVHSFNQSNIVFKFIDNTITTPILGFLHLTQIRSGHIVGSDIAQFTLMAICYGVVLYYGLVLPDVDSSKSALGRHVPFIEDTIGHRTLFHSIVPVILLVLATIFTSGLLQIIIGLISISYLFHLIEDAYSLQGINWFVFPLKTKWSKFRYRVDGAFEHVVFYIAWILTIGNISVFMYFSSAWTQLPHIFNLN